MSFYLFLLQIVVGVIAFGVSAVVLSIAVSMVVSIARQARQPKKPE